MLPSSRSFQAISSGIGLCCAHAEAANISATTAKADLDGVIRTARVSWLFGLAWPIPRRICTDFTVTIRCICATQRLNSGANAIMSRRVKRPLRPAGDRPKGARPYRGSQARRAPAHRSGGKPARFPASALRAAKPFVPEPEKVVPEPPPLPTKVQTVVVTADEDNMRVDRFLEARFPGLSFSHVQRIVRKGELRVNGKRADSKDRLEEGQSVRIPPLKLDAPKVAGHLSEAET